MRNIFFIIIILSNSLIIWAQEKNFEGIIEYESKSKRSDGFKKIESITAKFKYPYILRTSFDNSGKGNERITVFNFDEGKRYEINHLAKEVTVWKLTPNYKIYGDVKIDSLQKKIFAENIEAQLYIENSKYPTKFWYASKYFFNIPKEYTTYHLIPLFTNGRNIGLGIISRHKSVTLATEILPQALDNKEFALPKDYEIVDYTTQ